MDYCYVIKLNQPSVSQELQGWGNKENVHISTFIGGLKIFSIINQELKCPKDIILLSSE